MRNFKKLGIDTHGRTSGKVKTVCPWCNSTRRNKGDKSLSVNLDNGMYLCHHCGEKGCVPDDAEQRQREQRRAASMKKPLHFRRPTFHPESCTLSEKVERYLVKERCLSQAAIKELRIGEAYERIPSSGKEEHCICFNYFENGELVNTKFRTAKKEFKLVTGAELIPYHIDGIAHTPESQPSGGACPRLQPPYHRHLLRRRTGQRWPPGRYADSTATHQPGQPSYTP